jgi:AcrR family transcriptional regulator
MTPSSRHRRQHRRSLGQRPRLPRAEREQQIFELAHALFAERGYGTVTMDEVAAAVGVTKPLLYNYFGNKERLYQACMEPAGEALVSTVMRALEQTSTPEHALRAGIHAFFEFVNEDRSAWRVLFDETLPSEGAIAKRAGEYRSRLNQLVADAILEQLPAGLNRRGRAEVQGLSTAVMGAAEALARWWLKTDALSAAKAAELLVETLEPGLRARVEKANAQTGSRR